MSQPPPDPLNLSKRERQIMDILYERGSATAVEIHQRLPDPASYSAVRGMLNLLEDKGHLRHEQDGLRYVYLPVVAAGEARRRALSHVVRTFFGGSPAEAASALFDMPNSKLSRAELERLSALVRRAMREGR